MAQTRKPRNPGRNEGEGNRTAARQYNEAQRRFVESGKVAERAHEAAEHALETPERSVMKRAEEIGKSHKRAEDPEITRKP